MVLTLELAAAPQAELQGLVLYSGRGESLVGPLVERFTARTGIPVQVRYAGTPELARLILEEGDRSPADVFWAQDIGSLGTLHRAGRLRALPEALLRTVSPAFRYGISTWIPVSGRIRVLYFNPQRVSLPPAGLRLEDLAAPAYRGRVGWAPTNASFQLSVAALLQVWGHDRTLTWLRAMRDNGAKSFANNTALVDGIAAGEIDLALSNHYYLPRALASRPNLPVHSTAFPDRDPGNLLNASGAGILNTSRSTTAALRFLEFLLSEEAQRYFNESTHEYSVREGSPQPAAAPDIHDYLQRTPPYDYQALDRIDEVQALLRDAGLL